MPIPPRAQTDSNAEPQQAPAQAPTNTTTAQAEQALQKAFGEAKHFLGGLIPHPTESSRHVTILRHSHGLVLYRGGLSTAAVSVFSDSPLPPRRRYWLQARGFSGNTGMKAKALLRMHDDWLDVTPTHPVAVSQLDPADERAWQRDISKAIKKGDVRRSHQLRETVITRIPANAPDGYYVLVLCADGEDGSNTRWGARTRTDGNGSFQPPPPPKKGKVLCRSAVFRYVSASSDPSLLRGASLSTLPLELGARAASTYAMTVGSSLLGPARAAARPLLPQVGTVTSTVGQATLGAVSDLHQNGVGEAGTTYARVAGDGLAADHLDKGPRPPYPIDFICQAVPDNSGTNASGNDESRYKLEQTPDFTMRRLAGHYFGYARFHPGDSSRPKVWRPMVLAVDLAALAPTQMADISLGLRRRASLRLIGSAKPPDYEDVGTNSPQQPPELPPQSPAAIKVRVLGFIRSSPEHHQHHQHHQHSHQSTVSNKSNNPHTPGPLVHETLAQRDSPAAEAYDAAIARSIMTHPSWSHAAKPANVTTAERWAGAEVWAQRVAERVPLDRVGVRRAGDVVRDQQVAMVGGFYVVR